MAIDTHIENSVLYFPHIEIADTAWLKSALCIWDSVYRIVPLEYRPRDSDEVKEAVDAGLVRDIRLSLTDLKDTRENFHSFLESVPFIPDAIDSTPEGRTLVHREKLDERMISELSDLIGAITREGDWLDLPRGLAEGYMLFLSDTVARRRALPKLTNSESMFLAMQYFAMDGNMSELGNPADGEDMSAALVFRYMSLAGIDDHPMRTVLKFREANSEGREAFRQAVKRLVGELSKVEDQDHARELVLSFITDLQESERITLARLLEHFSQTHTILLYLGLPLFVKAFETASKSADGTWSLGRFGLAAIWVLGDVLKSRRSKWVPEEATYLAKLRESFVGDNPFPKRMPRFDQMMNEFLND